MIRIIVTKFGKNPFGSNKHFFGLEINGHQAGGCQADVFFGDKRYWDTWSEMIKKSLKSKSKED